MNNILDHYLPAWHRIADQEHRPEITDTTPDGQPRSCTLLMKDAQRRIRLGYFDGERWIVLGPNKEDWSGHAILWQWMVED